MALVKTYGIGHGDMYYIDHGSDNFTIVDCTIPEDREQEILDEVAALAAKKGIVRVVSTHPDQDHLSGLCELDDRIGIINFYCVKNEATKDDPTSDFIRYCELRDSTKAYYLYRGCSRRWMNESTEERGSSGLNIRWPDTSNQHYTDALKLAKDAGSPNNVSIVMTYSINDGATFMWMGDLETDFMEKVQDSVTLPHADVLFAPHHGRKSGRVPNKWLSDISPRIVVLGQAPSEYLHYYPGYDLLSQNSACDISFEAVDGKVHIYSSSTSYTVDYLTDEKRSNKHGRYIGTLVV